LKPGTITYLQSNYACIKEEENFLNLGQVEVKTEPERWYNLNTNRSIKSIRGHTFLVQPRVCGKIEQLQQFIKINRLTRNEVTLPDHIEGIEKMLFPTDSSFQTQLEMMEWRLKVASDQLVKEDSKVASSSSITKMEELGNNYPSINQECTVLNLSHKTITIKPFKWYNLETSRQVSNLTGKRYLIEPRVAGTIELIMQFILLNQLQSDQIITSPDMESIRDVITSTNTCKTKMISQIDIDLVPMEEIDQLQTFRFSHITVPAIITNILDGDTFECAAILNPNEMAFPISVTSGKRTTMGQNLTLCSQSGQCSTNLLLKLNIRLYGVDAADCIPSSDKRATIEQRVLMSNRKEAATEFVRKWATGCNNKVWLQLMGYDCRSRTLGRLYRRVDGDYRSTSDLTSQLLRYSHPVYGQVAVKYEGGNKKEAWSLT